MSKRQIRAIAQKVISHREELWPECKSYLWDRLAHDGFATIPKTMPLIFKAMDELSKGKPLSPTYLSLWCSTWDNSMANVSRPRDLAYASGFTGQRAEYSWIARIKLLHELHFIDVKPGKSGPISHVILWNPHKVIRWHHKNGTSGLTEATYNSLLDFALEIGAKDMLEDEVRYADRDKIKDTDKVGKKVKAKMK